MTRIFVGKGSCGIAAGIIKIENALKDLVGNLIEIEPTGCNGLCYLEPIVTVKKNGQFFDFVKVTEYAITEIVKFAQEIDNSASEFLISETDKKNLEKYSRIALRNCGRINPEKIEDYQYNQNVDEASVIDEIRKSGLRGRGGAGFLTHIKWQALKDAKASKKVVIVNADEGDPGAFMDRAILEGDPHSVLEGMLLCGKATGADTGVIYVRAEYPLAIKRLEVAIKQAKEKGLLGKFKIKIKAGAGAFVCGEETALIASLEGERGMPRLKPPFPFERGYFNMPSNINNVETLALVPYIINGGGENFAKVGTENSKGTKVFALAGKVKNGGLIEVPMGVTLEECIFDFGGGIVGDKEFKAVQLGGPSGGCVPKSLLNTVVDYLELSKTGAIMGSGGMVVMDESTCMVDMARFFLEFTCNESCGKCTSCRIGTKRMLEILERIILGNGQNGDIEKLESLASSIKDGALCGLGQTAPNPVITAIKYFKDEFIEHIENKKCRAKSCSNLLKFSILDNCVGCTLCKKICPTSAIEGEAGQKHKIIQEKCIKCGECENKCKFKAIICD